MMHLVGHVSEVANEGDYIRLPIGDEDIVVMREADEMVAFDNRCPHRGALIFDGLFGNAPPICRYHGRRARGCDVRRLEGTVFNNWIFVGPKSETPNRWEDGAGLEGLGAILTKSDISRVRSYDRPYLCHWTVAVENALDWQHISAVHPGSLGRLGLHPVAGGRGPDGSSIELFSSTAPGLQRLAPINPLPADYVHAYFAPYACLASTRGMTWSLQHYLPAANGYTRFISRLYAPIGTRPGLIQHAMKLNERVFDEDAAVCARVPQGHWSELSAAEWRIAHFRAAQ